jgi:hypothetical protein
MGVRRTASRSRWPSSAVRAHAVVKSVLTQAEALIAARRLAGARPHLAAVAGIVHHEDLWQLCPDEHRSRRPHRRLGYPRPLVQRSRRGRAAARGAATRRDDPMASDRRPDRTARTPRLALIRSASRSSCHGRLRPTPCCQTPPGDQIHSEMPALRSTRRSRSAYISAESRPWRSVRVSRSMVGLAVNGQGIRTIWLGDPGRFHRSPCSSPPSDTNTGDFSPKPGTT